MSSSAATAAPFEYFRPTTPQPLGNLQPAPSQPNNLGTFSIVINPGSGLSSNAAALAAFNRAAQSWANRISDPITVTIDADLTTTQPGGGTFPANVIGSTSAVTLQGGYDTIRNAMVADTAAHPGGPANNAIVANLPTAAQFVATLPAGRSLSGNALVNKANAKALGFVGLDAPSPAGFGPSDGNIVFNSAFTFDFDSSNGVTAGSIDFQTTAAHEIGHLLGFNSEVDAIDQSTAASLPTVSPTTQDLFRFARTGAQHPTTAAQFTTLARNLVPGTDDVNSDIVNEYRMSTGVTGGDGQQASHWKADEQTGIFIGIMDPTLANGVTEPLTEADFQAMDLIGYDVSTVPEPTSIAVVGLAATGLLLRRRRGWKPDA